MQIFLGACESQIVSAVLRPGVLDHVRLLTEAQSAHRALVWLLSCVFPHVVVKPEEVV